MKEKSIGWKQVPLGEIAVLRSGGTPSKSKPEFWSGTIPWLTAKDMKTPNLRNTLDKISEEACNEGSRLMPGKTIFVLVRGMTLLKDIPIGIAHCPMAFNQDVKAIEAKNGIHPEFLFFSLLSKKNQLMNTVDRSGHGTGRLATEKLIALKIPLPPLEEQEKISRILGFFEHQLEVFSEFIFYTTQLKMALMKKLLAGQMRFPEFGKPVKTIGQIPLGWYRCHLSDVFGERNETDPSLPLLSITADSGIIPRDEVDRKDTSNSDKSKYKRIVPGDIGYNTMRMWQGVSAVSSLEGIVSPAYTVCIPKENCCSEYFAFLFKSPAMIHRFHRYSQGLVDDTLNLKFHHFAQITVDVPPLLEQKKIARVLSVIDREIGILNQVASRLQVQKEGLMQQLLSGKIRVGV